MTLKPNDLRALGILAVALVGLVIYRASDSSTPAVVASAESPAMLDLRLEKLRRAAATLPAKTATLTAVREQLRLREKNVMTFATAPQAQAHLLEVARRLAAANKIEPRGGDFTAPTLLGADYGQVTVAITFESTIESFVNFLSDLSKEPELIAPADVRIAAGNVKNKTINVRLTLSGVVPKKLVPERKGVLG